MQQPILTPEQLEAYNRGEAITIQKPKKVKRVEPNENDGYITLFDGVRNNMCNRYWVNGFVGDKYLWQNYLAFSTKEELEKQMQYIEAMSYIRTYIANNFGEWKPNWRDDDERKWVPVYNASREIWISLSEEHLNRPQPYPYLQTKEMCNQFHKDCEPQLNILRDFWN